MVGGRRRLVALAAALTLATGLAACSSSDKNPTAAPSSSVATSAPQTSSTTTSAPVPSTAATKQPVATATAVLSTGLAAPWSVVFLPDGRALISERDTGRILARAADGNVSEVAKIPEQGSGEGGLLGLAVSPSFATDGLIYAYFTSGTDNRVVRFKLADRGQNLQPIVTGIPAGGVHNGGRIAFGPDGLLYIGTGEAGQRANAQNRSSLGGKILRVTPEGQPAPGNPFPNSPVYSYGHRNVQGLAWDANGQLYASEFGQNKFDELNRIQAGGNYGWPDVEGRGGAANGFIDPVDIFSTDEASPSGAAIVVHGAIPQWEGNVFLASLRGERLWRLTLAADGKSVSSREALYQGQFGRLRLVIQAPDGSLWLLTNNRDGRGTPKPGDDKLIRIAPQ
jgi:glucose/arabinose dehydrogenase